MIDRTHPDSGRIITSSDVIADLQDRIAELESELEAVGAGGVQALSAAPETIAKLRHLYQNMVNGAVRDTASAKRIAEGLLAPAIEALERDTPPAEQQAAPKAPGEPFDECFPGEPRVAVPQGLIGAACFAISNKRDGGKVLEQLRRYSVGDLSQPLAPQQEAQEPYAYAVYFPDQPTVELVHDLDELTDDLTNREYQITKLYTAPQPAPAPLSDDVVQKTWALLDELEKLRGADRYDEDWVTLNKRDSELRAALAAQGGKV